MKFAVLPFNKCVLSWREALAMSLTPLDGALALPVGPDGWRRLAGWPCFFQAWNQDEGELHENLS